MVIQKSGRPAIYQSDDEYDLLPEQLKYRHVRFELDSRYSERIDFTWEREWRIRTDRLRLNPDVTTVVVPDRKWANEIKQPYFDWLAEGIDTHNLSLDNIQDFPWHIITFEDLGVPIESCIDDEVCQE